MQFSVRKMDAVMNTQPYNKWSSVYRSSSSLLALVGGVVDCMVCESVSKADLLSDHLDSQQSR